MCPSSCHFRLYFYFLESLTRYALFDHQFRSDTEGVVLDSDDMMGIIPRFQDNVKYVQLTDVTGHTTSVEVPEVVYPILTESKEPYVFVTRDTTMVLSDTKDKIISLTVLLKTGFKVEFAAGTSDDPNFGGYLITSAGSHYYKLSTPSVLYSRSQSCVNY